MPVPSCPVPRRDARHDEALPVGNALIERLLILVFLVTCAVAVWASA